MIEDRFFRNADYVRLKEVYMGYTFSPESLKRLAGISSFLIYISGNNLWTLPSSLRATLSVKTSSKDSIHRCPHLRQV